MTVLSKMLQLQLVAKLFEMS